LCMFGCCWRRLLQTAGWRPHSNHCMLLCLHVYQLLPCCRRVLLFTCRERPSWMS
jgi:hypothetical protein